MTHEGAVRCNHGGRPAIFASHGKNMALYARFSAGRSRGAKGAWRSEKFATDNGQAQLYVRLVRLGVNCQRGVGLALLPRVIFYFPRSPVSNSKRPLILNLIIL